MDEDAQVRTGSEDARDGAPPDLMQIVGRLRGPLGVLAVAATGLFLIAFFTALKLARPFVLPVVGALLLNFFLTPIVRFLRRRGVPTVLGAALVLLTLVGATAFGVYRLTAPATEWLSRADVTVRIAERRLAGIRRPVEEVQRAVEEVEQAARGGEDGEPPEQEVTVRSDDAGLGVLERVRAFVVGVVVMFFLLFFLLASGEVFLRKLARVLPEFRYRRTAVEVARRTESEITTYLFTMALINVGVGVVIGAALWLMDMPSPILWGVMAGLLNFVPYLGPLVGIIVTGTVALATFSSVGHALAVPAVYLLVNAMEGYLVTPWVMGRRLTLNPVAIFVSVLFWGWLWGIPGALLAVPLLTVFKILCDNVEVLSPVGEFLAG